MEEQVYKKKGRRYIPIGYSDGFMGFPMEGIWLVEHGTAKKSSECILRIGELQDLRPYVDLLYGSRDRLVEFLAEQSRNGVVSIKGITYNDFVNNMLKSVCETT